MNKDVTNKKTDSSISFLDIAWNIWCVASIVGIWPRHIEPKLITTTRRTIPIRNLPQSLQGLKVLHFSDLHFQNFLPESFYKKLIKKISGLNPDLVFFTGDFICSSQIENPERLEKILSEINAPYGCYAVLGNHDYQQYVSISSEGHYDVADPRKIYMRKGWRRLFYTPTLTKKVTDKALKVPMLDELLRLLKRTPFQLLHNQSQLIPIRDTHLNICGLGEHMLGRCQPDIAFQNYATEHIGIILSHNPDSIPVLKNYPGELILSGHTHGGQVNIPWLWKKFTILENPHLKSGLKRIDNKWINVSRGLGAGMQFRWFSIPELSLLTLERQNEHE